MRSLKRILGTGCLLLVASNMVAQSDFGVWTSIEASTKLNKQLELSLDGEYRTQSNSSLTERIATGISLSYKNKKVPFLKADVGYSVMSMYGLGETAIKYCTVDDDDYEEVEGNPIPRHKNVDSPYWYTRHRVTASLTGSVKWGRFKFSLRERYQFTHRMRSYCDRERHYYFGEPLYKWDYELEDFGQPETLVDEKKAKSDHKLRSRLSVSYDIKQCPFEPFAEVEMYNELDKAFAYDKIRYTVGTDYKFNKEHKLTLYYRYQDYADIDEVSGHILGIGYAFEF